MLIIGETIVIAKLKEVGGGSYSIILPPTGYGSRTPTHSGGSHRDTYELNTANNYT